MISRRNRRMFEEAKEEAFYDIDEVMEYLDHALLEAFPEGEGGYNPKEDLRDYFFEVEIPVNVRSEYVDIPYITATCDVVGSDRRASIRFVGCDCPSPDLLDPFYDGDVIIDPAYESHLNFEKHLVLDPQKSTRELKREIDSMVSEYVDFCDKAISLWKDMQKALDEHDQLMERLYVLRSNFAKKTSD